MPNLQHSDQDYKAIGLEAATSTAALVIVEGLERLQGPDNPAKYAQALAALLALSDAGYRLVRVL